MFDAVVETWNGRNWIVGTTPNGCISPGDEMLYGAQAQPAFRYSQVATKTGGVVGSICDLSFEATLVQIAEALNTLAGEPEDQDGPAQQHPATR